MQKKAEMPWEEAFVANSCCQIGAIIKLWPFFSSQSPHFPSHTWQHDIYLGAVSVTNTPHAGLKHLSSRGLLFYRLIFRQQELHFPCHVTEMLASHWSGREIRGCDWPGRMEQGAGCLGVLLLYAVLCIYSQTFIALAARPRPL